MVETHGISRDPAEVDEEPSQAQ